MLIAFLVMTAVPEFVNGNVRWDEVTPTATECALFFCVNAYQSESRNGQLVEHVARTWAVR